MPYVRWENSLKVGNPIIDEQHEKLFGLINELHEQLQGGAGNKALKSVLGTLLEYVLIHFSEEERLMRKNNYPEFDDHKAEHDRYAADIREFITEYQSNTPLLARKVLLYLGEWARHHISTTDNSYRSMFHDNGPSA